MCVDYSAMLVIVTYSTDMAHEDAGFFQYLGCCNFRCSFVEIAWSHDSRAFVTLWPNSLFRVLLDDVVFAGASFF